MDMEKRTQELRDRLKYIQDIFAPDENSNVSMLETRFGEFVSRVPELNKQEAVRQLETLEELFRFLEKKHVCFYKKAKRAKSQPSQQ